MEEENINNGSSSQEDVHYEQLFNECESNYEYSQNQYGLAISELESCYESLSGQDYLYYNLYWNDGENTYSIPLTNDIYLPNGYRAYSDSGVVAVSPIQSIEYAISMDDNDFNDTVLEGFGVLFIFLFGSGCLLLLAKYIKKILPF